MFRCTLRLAAFAALSATPFLAVFAQDTPAPSGPAAPPPAVPSNPAAAPPPHGTPAPAAPAQPVTPRTATPSMTPPAVNTPGSAPSPASAPAPTSAPTPAPGAPPAGDAATNRVTGIETNRVMIAAEAPTDIVVNGSAVASCGVAIDFGDGSRTAHVVSETAPFPVRTAHTYAKMGDFTVRVSGAASGATPACEGVLDARIHVSPAGSKVEMITLTVNSCPEGWKPVGEANTDKSFRCTPVPDASAPTNLIHCTEGMKYFAKGGYIGCMQPGAVFAEAAASPAKAAAKGKAGGKGMPMRKGMEGKGMPMHNGMGGKGMMATGKDGDASNAPGTSSNAPASATSTPNTSSSKKTPARKPARSDKTATADKKQE